MKNLTRHIEKSVFDSLAAFPVVYIAGPRQAGKTTLVQHIAKQHHKSTYITFDDLQIRSSAQHDPEAFLHSFEGPVILDEIQMVPEIFHPLKIMVDENRHKKNGGRGKFLLTGSAHVMALPKLSDALVGRMVLHTLLPFSTQEIQNKTDINFIEHLFTKKWKFTRFLFKSFLPILTQASFPELLTLNTCSLRNEWCNGYLNTLLQRDIRFLMEVEKIGVLPDMLRLLAARAGTLLNEAALSRDTMLNLVTVKRYRLLLESLFLILVVPAWSNNLGKRLIKAPKVYINDLNILSYLLNVELENLPKTNTMLLGQIIENFVAIELSKQLTSSTLRAKLYHYRTSSGQEVDFILEGPQNHIVGIEVKARSKITAKDFQHLEVLQNELGEKFESGLVFYLGTDIVPFGKNLWAVPLMALWAECV